MRILIATDAWHPQVNGVVRSLESMSSAATKFGAEFEFLTPQHFACVPMPTYPEISLALAARSKVAALCENMALDHIHIATEGPIGLAARAWCRKIGRLFTTSYHTRFPEYISARLPIPKSLTYSLLRRFHNASAGIMVSTASLTQDLEQRGFKRLMPWSRGVDHNRFSPTRRIKLDLPGPIFLSAGRLAPEKNIEAFLSLNLPGSKVVVGEGPARPALQARFPDAHFLGLRTGDDLAALYAAADVFVFPSRTDTFGMVLLEALACGLPVAAFPVPGPLDVIGDSGAGILDADLGAACLSALDIPREKARAHALTYTWDRSAQQFLNNIENARARRGEQGVVSSAW
jgi:glycosyltransferase involved in cell wall biosynthesis